MKKGSIFITCILLLTLSNCSFEMLFEEQNNKEFATTVPIGVNVSWFSDWNESQPLANVAHSARDLDGAFELDALNHPTGDMHLCIYAGDDPGGADGDGCSGGAQTGVHQGSFYGQATIYSSSCEIKDQEYDPETNRTTFSVTTTKAQNTTLYITNTKREPEDIAPTGIKDLKIIRPGHGENDIINKAFQKALNPFETFRVGPNWGITYETESPVWEKRGKPDGMFTTLDEEYHGEAPWETLTAMANEMQKNLWICLPPNADNNYLTKIFQIFLYGSDGVNPYTSPQSNPVWEPLDSNLILYFEIGNEVWNGAMPYAAISHQMRDLATAEINGGDPYYYGYAYMSDIVKVQAHYARRTAEVSELCRSIVGDHQMMSRFRPVLSSQSAYSYVGQVAISYLKCVFGGHDWYTAWIGDEFPGRFLPNEYLTPEDGVSINGFGNVAHPLDYYIYGYATAPYVNGDSLISLRIDFESNIKADISENLAFARSAGVVPLSYEGGIETYHSYNEPGIGSVITEMLNHWYDQGGDLFMYYSLAGNEGSGLIPDLSRQDPGKWPKLGAIYRLILSQKFDRF